MLRLCTTGMQGAQPRWGRELCSRPMSQSRAVGELVDGTQYYAPVGVLVRDGDDRIQCHLCGRFMRMVGGTHLRVGHGWSIEQYREAFQLREHVATCSRELSEQYRESAKARLGRRKFGEPPADPPRPGRRTPGWRSLAAVRPDLVAELHPARNRDMDPEAVAVESHLKAWWRCGACGHEWQATITNRTNRGSGCPRCSLQKRARTQSRVPLERSLAARRPDLVLELHPTRNVDLDPREIGARSSKTVWWQCKTCGYEWQAVIANRTHGTGCPACWQRRRQAATSPRSRL
jgi:predicted Zn-ribbon and HTH transcriptional regulator